MTDQNAPEPSMDEILASIRRIISEEAPVAEAPVAAPLPQPAAAESEAQAEHAPYSEPEPQPEPGRSPEPEVQPQPEALYEPMHQPEYEPVVAEATNTHEPAPAASRADEPLVSQHAAMATASAFDDLAATVGEAAKSGPTTALPAPGRTLEDLVAELLRPLLKSWLDENLADIVRQRVDEEVARIAKGRVR